MLLTKGPKLGAIGAQGPAKRSVAEGIRPPEVKFETLFTPKEQRQILSRLVRLA